ncbi:MAG: cytochrome c [Myxococcales bacterium]|nr:cytochrome c [Myxococcales bacterium]
MIGNRGIWTRGTSALILAIAFGAAGAASAGDVENIKYRQKVMSGIGADMGAISDILKHGLPFTANIAIHANKLENAAELIPSAFEAKTADIDTDAKADIWMKPDEWKKLTADFALAADVLEDAADDEDPVAIKAAFKGLGKSCGGCHDAFRKPKEESYKNR